MTPPFIGEFLLFQRIKLGALLGKPCSVQLRDLLLNRRLHGLAAAREDARPNQQVQSVQQSFINGDSNFGNAHASVLPQVIPRCQANLPSEFPYGVQPNNL